MNAADVKLNHLNSMVEEIEDYAILMLDTDGNISNWNKGAQKIKGYTSEEIIGKNFKLFYLPEDQEKGLPESLLATARANGKVHHIGWRVRKDGNRFWGAVSITAIHDKEGEIVGFTKVTRDLTERRLLEESRREYMNELENHSKEMEQFTYIASHDLQEPLRTIKGFIYLLRDKCEPILDEEGKMFMDTIEDSVVRMQNLIKAILDYSLLGNDKTITEIDCNQLIEDIKKDLAGSIMAKEAIIEYSGLPTVHGYAVELRQLFQNLINNAIKFSKPDTPPHVSISASTQENKFLFVVKDNGIGIDQRYQEKIFQIFQRLHPRNKYEGSGIGLSNAKKIVELHNGKIWVESEPGEGSSFYFLLSDLQ